MGEDMQGGIAYQQDARGSMAYPAPGTLNRLLFKMPLLWWRAGLGNVLGPGMLVLTTWGRKSHLPRHTMLSYTPLNGHIYLGAGWGTRCDWLQNLVANPHVTLQVCSRPVTGMDGEAVIPAIARRVVDEDEFSQITMRLFETGGDSHFKPWLSSLGIAYDAEEMIAQRERIFQIALDLQPVKPVNQLVEAGYPSPMEADLKWVWLVMAVSFGMGWLIGRFRK